MMWGSLFQSVLSMSLTASVAILVVLAARLLLRRAPKIFSYALWTIVLFRLCCPVAVTSELSLFGWIEKPFSRLTAEVELPTKMDSDTDTDAAGTQSGISGAVNIADTQTGTDAEKNADGLQTETNKNPAADERQPEANISGTNRANMAVTVPGSAAANNRGDFLKNGNWIEPASYLWGVGIAAMAVYSLISMILIRRRLVGAVPLRDNIYVCDYIQTPFVMGIFKPRIYLCSALKKHEMEYIILHEQQHIRRFDHVIKIVAFAALCVHWFNPLVWAAFVLAGKDMEMSCDEAVVAKMGDGIRWDYSKSLLVLATGHQMIAGAPLAFGEGNTKGRIHNLLKKKKAGKWLAGVAVVVLIAAGVLLLTDPAGSAMADTSENVQNGQFGRDDETLEDGSQQEMQSGDGQTEGSDSSEAESQTQPAVNAENNSLDHIEGEKSLKQQMTEILWQRMVSMVLDLAPSDRDDWLAYWSGESQVDMILGDFDAEDDLVKAEGKDNPLGRSYQVNTTYDMDEAYNTGWYWLEHYQNLSLEERCENADGYLAYSYHYSGKYTYSDSQFAQHREEGLLEVTGTLKRTIYPAGETFLNQREIEGQYVGLWNAVMGAAAERYLEQVGGIPVRMAGTAYLMNFDTENLTAEFWVFLEGQAPVQMMAYYTWESCEWVWQYEGEYSTFDPGYQVTFDETAVIPDCPVGEELPDPWLGLEFDLTTERLAD